MPPAYLGVPNYPPLAPDVSAAVCLPRRQAGTRLVRAAERPYNDVNSAKKKEENGAREKPNNWKGLSAI
jgi:hypothetical protein